MNGAPALESNEIKQMYTHISAHCQEAAEQREELAAAEQAEAEKMQKKKDFSKWMGEEKEQRAEVTQWMHLALLIRRH